MAERSHDRPRRRAGRRGPPSTAVASLAALLAGCSADAPPPDRPNLLVFAPDTLRADRVFGGAQGEPPVASHMAALAERGVSFTAAYSQGGWTLPALSSFLLGSYPNPVDAGESDAGWFTEDQRTLPEILAAYGYHTAVFWGPTVPGAIATFSTPFQQVGTTRPRAVACQDVLDWLDNRPPEPFFVLVHNIDFHVAPLRDTQQGIDVDGPGSGDVKVAIRQMFTQEYDEPVRDWDAGLGRVIERLDDGGLSDRTLVVLFSNHGEDLLEHTNRPDHGLLYDTLIHVPLVVVDPADARAGTRIDQPVRLMDVAPTLLERVGIPPDHLMDGASFLPLLHGEVDPVEREPIFSMTTPGNFSLRTPRLKLIACQGNGCRAGAPAGHRLDYKWFEAYDLPADPDEQHDLFEERAPSLLAPLELLLAWHEVRMAARDSARVWKMEASERKALEDHGYWGLVAPSQ